MPNTTTVIVIIIAILLLMTLFRGGMDEIKTNPLGSTLESGKIVLEKGKEILNSEPNEKKNLGQIPCISDQQCNNLLESCEGLCFCQEGTCWR